ncbi:flagellar hook-length control protein FliK [Leifsonia sp. NPDC056665]|uniref:flagellar hook-length control protein FliK n=1 Tax=Leifsonia sp. NPDC056665 TaxID=3345901 RepID=UPI0036B53BAE
MSAVVTGFAGAAALLAPASPSDASSNGSGTAFGTALLSALAGDAAAPTPPAAPADPAASADAAAPAPTTPQTAPPAPTPAPFLGLATPAPAPLADAATTTSPSAPDEGPHGKSGSTRSADADQHHDAPSPAVADVFAAGQLAVQQALAAAPVLPATPTPAPPVQTPASSAPGAPASAPPVTAPAPAPVQEASAQPIVTAGPAAAAQPFVRTPVAAPARPASKAPSAPSTPIAGDAQPTAPAAATPVPAQAPTFAAALASAAPAAASTAPTPAPPLQQQLAQPVMTLARQPDGDHVVVVRVAPDDLGPVTVHARVSDTGVHIELFAPNDAGRDAIRQILTDLRRDLNATTANSSVSVSDQNAPGAEGGGGDRSPWASAEERGTTARADLSEEPAEAAARSVVPDLPNPTVALPGARTLDIVV